MSIEIIFNTDGGHRAVRAAAGALLLVFGLGVAPAVVRAQPAGTGVPPVATSPTADPCVRGRDLYRRGNHAEARPALAECLASQGDRLEVLLPLTVIALEGEDPLSAMGYADRALMLAPDDPEALYWRGRALLANGREKEARQSWDAALLIDTSHLGVLEGLARMALSDGDPTRAYQLLMQMRQRGMNQAWLHRLMADIAAGRGLWPQALAHLQDALAVDPDQPGDWLSAAELSVLGGKDDQAIAYARRAVGLRPDAASLGGLGEAFFAAEQVDSALVYLRRAVAAGDAKPRIRFNLANAMEVAGLSEEAGEHFRLFLKDEPQDPVGHFNYAIHLQKIGQLEAALGEVDQALRLDPGMLTAGVVKVQILEDLGRWDAALGALAVLKTRDRANEAEITEWEQRLTGRRDESRQARAEGKMHLLHMVLRDRTQLSAVTAELAKGGDFASLVVQYSQGAGASRGGDIGWMQPQEMVEPLRTAIANLNEGEVSLPIESQGLIHVFKRIP